MPRKMLAIVLMLAAIFLPGCNDNIREALTSLCDPTKLVAITSDRAVNQQVREIVYWLERARLDGRDPATEMREVMAAIGWGGTAKGELTAEAMVRNLQIAERLGCLDEAGMADLRLGNAPIIRNGIYAGDELGVAQMIPASVCPELDTTLANLELMPLRLNRGKSPPIERQFDLAVKFYDAGLLSYESLLSIYRAFAAVLIAKEKMDPGICGVSRLERRELFHKLTVELKKRRILKDRLFLEKSK